MVIARQTMRVLSMIMLMTLLRGSVALRGKTQDENWKRCRSDDSERSIRGCSALIQSSHDTGINLAAKAFTNRGNAYAHKGDYDRAIQDYDQALQLNPSLDHAFYGRGWAYARPAVTKRSKYQRTWRMIRQLRNLGYRIELPNPQANQAQA